MKAYGRPANNSRWNKGEAPWLFLSEDGRLRQGKKTEFTMEEGGGVMIFLAEDRRLWEKDKQETIEKLNM